MSDRALDPDELARMASSDEPADLELAHRAAVGGMRGDPRLQQIAAMAYDRGRALAGRPQKFGTQAFVDAGSLALWPVDPATTDTERAKWGVGTLQQLGERLAVAPVLTKSALRAAVRRRRAALSEQVRDGAAASLARRGVEALAARVAGEVVAAYWPIGAEVDPRPLARALREAHGAALALPVVDGEQLTFRRWDDDASLQDAGFGALGPASSAPEVRPAVVLAPLVGCDRRGGRLGQGKGFYDRALAQLDAAGGVFVVGVACDCQVAPAVPTEPHDRRLDAVLTEREWIALSE